MALGVLRRGGRTCKSLRFTFRASHLKAGGCEGARSGGNTSLEALLDLHALESLPSWRQQIIKDIHVSTSAREVKSFSLQGSKDAASSSVKGAVEKFSVAGPSK